MLLLGCTTKQAVKDYPIVSKEMAYFEFDERPSIATTPVYKIIVTADDSFILIPEEYIKYKKTVHGILPKGSFKNVLGIVEQYKLMGKSSIHRGIGYYGKKVNCPSHHTDSPGWIFSLVDGNTRTYIYVDLGCSGYPEYNELMKFFEDIKMALDVKNLIYPDYTTEYWK